MILDRVYDANNKPTSLSRYEGQWIFLVGRCPQCRKRVAKECVEIVDPENAPRFNVQEITCCKKFFPTKYVLVNDSHVAHVTELGSTYRDDPGDLATSADAWSIYILWAAGRKLERCRMPLLPEPDSIHASEWLTKMNSLVSDPGQYSDFSLSFAEKVARQIEKKGLYRDFWSLVQSIYKYSSALTTEQTSAFFALYRAIFRYLSGDDGALFFLDKDGSRKLLVEEEDVLGEAETVPEGTIWPYDIHAFSFMLADPVDWEFRVDEVSAFTIAPVVGESAFVSNLDKVRSQRRYTLTPGGVRALLPGQSMGIREVLLKEQGTLVTAKVVKDPDFCFLCWFDWSTGIGFSPWQVVNEYTPAKDPLLGVVAGVFTDLVTGQEREIKKRTDNGESAILLPGDGQVKMRTVYMGRGEDRGQIRVRLPVERKAPNPHAVAGHLRRVKKSASSEAAERAGEYGIAVPEGYTFVRPFMKGRRNIQE